METKIKAEHLARGAYVYIRQSTLGQVKHNVESQRLQYQLQDRAESLGWRDVVIIDDDQGRSGGGQVTRPGFERLLAAVCSNQVGAIFCWEASRLSRNNREWYQLLDLCAIVDTLIIDPDGIYDAGNINDRVFLGMKGTMSEFEWGVFRQRSQAALKQKAARGELYRIIAAGYIVTKDNRCELHPNQRVRDAIHSVFEKFRQVGSARQVLLWFRSEGIELPCKVVGGRRDEFVWKLPTKGVILSLLKNPIYAGAYVYGRTETRVRFEGGQPIKSMGHAVARDGWQVWLPDHHEGYISWPEYLSNQRRLQQNSNRHGSAVRGAIKRGSALLVGLFRCQRCGRKLKVRYSGPKAATPRYVCHGATAFGESDTCISFNATQVEKAVVAELLRVIEPQALAAAEAAQRLYEQQQRETEQLLINALAQAEYEANRCYEQYTLVDPHNRLVAATLEQRWNEALSKVDSVKQQLQQIRHQHQPLSPQQREQLFQLTEHLPRVWYHPQANVMLKKRIIQTVMKEIMVHKTSDNYLELTIHWAGGKHSQLKLKRPRRGERPKDGKPNIETIIQDLAEVAPDHEIARILNRLGITTSRGNSWIACRVASFRHKHHIPVFNEAAYNVRGLMNLKQAAQQLGINEMAAHRLIKANILTARQVIKHGSWIIEKEHLTTPTVQQAAAALKRKITFSMTNPDQLILE